MEITKGKWEVLGDRFEGYNVIADNRYIGEFRKKEHSVLAADAGNTYQATNKLPSELAEANKELLNVLKEFLVEESHNDLYGENYPTIIKMKSLIKKHSHA